MKTFAIIEAGRVVELVHATDKRALYARIHPTLAAAAQEATDPGVAPGWRWTGAGFVPPGTADPAGAKR